MSHLPSFKPILPFWILSSSLGNRLQFFTKAARQNSAWAFWLPNTSENLLLYFCAILTFSPHSHPFVLFLSSFSKLTDNFECLLQHFSEVSDIIRWTGSHLCIFRSSLDFLSCNCCRFWIFCWLNWVTDRGTYPVACAGTHDVRVKTRPCCLQGKSNQRPTSRDVMRLHLLTVVTVSELCSSCRPYMVWSNGNLDNIMLLENWNSTLLLYWPRCDLGLDYMYLSLCYLRLRSLFLRNRAVLGWNWLVVYSRLRWPDCWSVGTTVCLERTWSTI